MVAYSTEPVSQAVLPSIDWLAVSCRSAVAMDEAPLYVPAPWVAAEVGRTAVWKRRWFIMDACGNKVATVLFCPHSPRIPATSVLLEVANRYLYYEGLGSLIDRICECIGLEVIGVSRIDLCGDFACDITRWDAIDALACQRARVKSLRSGSVWWQVLNGMIGGVKFAGERVPHCLNFGGTESVVHWKIYWKWLEIMQAPIEERKEYIVRMWQANGLPPQFVWRCEVSLTKTSRLGIAGGRPPFLYEWLENYPDYLRGFINSRMVVSRNEGHVDSRNDSIMPFLMVPEGERLKFRLPNSERDVPMPDVRLARKLWDELTSIDAHRNTQSYDIVRDGLRTLCADARVLNKLAFGMCVPESDVLRAIDEA